MRRNPNGVQGIFFLIFAGATLFFGVKLISAITDPLQDWIDYCLTPAHRASVTDKQKRTMLKMNAFLYVAMMTVSVFIILGPRLGLSLERMALPLGFGFLACLLINYLLSIFGVIYMLSKDKKNKRSSGPATRGYFTTSFF